MIAGILFTLPAVLGLLIWTIGPMIASLILSFTQWDILGGVKWIGFSNYINLFTQDLFFKKSLLVTFYYAAGSVIVTLIYTFFIALLLNQDIKGKAIFRTIYYLPSMVPAVASSILWMWLYNPDFGLFNTILRLFGLPKQLWIYDETTVIPSLILMSVWGSGNTVIIFLAGLQDVPRQLLESVEIDGGNWWHKMVAVTIPMVSPIIFFNLVMGLIGAFQTFTQAYIMTGGGPDNASLFYVYFLYREAFERNNMGYACALAWILFIIIALLSLIVFRTSQKWVYYEGGNQ